MKKSISKSLVFIGMATMFATSLFLGLSSITTNQTYATNQTSLDIAMLDTSLLTVSVYDHNNEILRTDDYSDTLILNNGSNESSNWRKETYKWRDVKNFKITLDTSKLTEATTYNYSYSVSWTPELVEKKVENDTIIEEKAKFDTDHTITATLFEAESNKDNISNEIYFTIDDNTLNKNNSYVANSKLGDSYKSHGGYGLYIFTFSDAATGTKQSQVFELVPDSVEGLAKPIISVKTISSNERINDAYLFSLDSSYDYVDRSLIYWSVSGTGRDGRTYVLSPEEITNPNTTNAIFPESAIERTGITFSFDPKIEGTWKAYCQVFKGTNDTAVYATAVSEKVSTVKGLSTQSLVWIVVGAAAAAGIGVAVIIYISIKKERVY